MFNINKLHIQYILECQAIIPVQIVKLAQSFNIEVYKVSDMKSDISGAIVNENGEEYIMVNKL